MNATSSEGRCPVAVPRRVLADRMACLKGGVAANVVIPTPSYIRFATHYGFAPDFCHGEDPRAVGCHSELYPVTETVEKVDGSWHCLNSHRQLVFYPRQ